MEYVLIFTAVIVAILYASYMHNPNNEKLGKIYLTVTTWANENLIRENSLNYKIIDDKELKNSMHSTLVLGTGFNPIAGQIGFCIEISPRQEIIDSIFIPLGMVDNYMLVSHNALKDKKTFIAQCRIEEQKTMAWTEYQRRKTLNDRDNPATQNGNLSPNPSVPPKKSVASWARLSTMEAILQTYLEDISISKLADCYFYISRDGSCGISGSELLEVGEVDVIFSKKISEFESIKGVQLNFPPFDTPNAAGASFLQDKLTAKITAEMLLLSKTEI